MTLFVTTLKGDEFMLRVIRISLPGQWADGWLYKEHLILWSFTGEMHVLPMVELIRLIREQAPPSFAVAADYAIFRNDWKGSEQFRRLRTMTEFTEALHWGFGGGEAPAGIVVDSCLPVPVPGDPVPGTLLDASLYANRVYLASTDGLFETRFDPDKPKYSHPLVRRLDHEVCAINAKYGVINASAGGQGLLFAPVSFDDTNWWRQDQDFVTIAERSFDNSFASFHVLNYTGDSYPALLRAETRPGRSRERTEFQESQVTGYQPGTDIGKFVLAPIGGERTEVLGNSAHRLLLRRGDILQVVSISVSQEGELTAKLDRRYGIRGEHEAPLSPVLRTHAVGAGFVLETADGIHLYTPGGSYQLGTEQTATIRTFVNARRHQDTILIIEPDHISLCGFLESAEDPTKPGVLAATR